MTLTKTRDENTRCLVCEVILLDTSELKVGSVVRLTGEVVSLNGSTSEHGAPSIFALDPIVFALDPIVIALDGEEDISGRAYHFNHETLKHAELVSTPVTFTDEQIEAIKEGFGEIIEEGGGLTCFRMPDHFVEWLESHREKK